MRLTIKMLQAQIEARDVWNRELRHENEILKAKLGILQSVNLVPPLVIMLERVTDGLTQMTTLMSEAKKKLDDERRSGANR